MVPRYDDTVQETKRMMEMESNRVQEIDEQRQRGDDRIFNNKAKDGGQDRQDWLRRCWSREMSIVSKIVEEMTKRMNEDKATAKKNKARGNRKKKEQVERSEPGTGR